MVSLINGCVVEFYLATVDHQFPLFNRRYGISILNSTFSVRELAVSYIRRLRCLLVTYSIGSMRHRHKTVYNQAHAPKRLVQIKILRDIEMLAICLIGSRFPKRCQAYAYSISASRQAHPIFLFEVVLPRCVPFSILLVPPPLKLLPLSVP
jgi:hypothetical protein